MTYETSCQMVAKHYPTAHVKIAGIELDMLPREEKKNIKKQCFQPQYVTPPNIYTYIYTG